MDSFVLTRRTLLASAAAAGASSALAQPKEVRIVVPYTPGGATDVLARMYADRLRVARGVTAIVDNRPGAGGQIGVQLVQRARPDGSTLLFTPPAYIQGAILNKGSGIDPVKDFQPIVRLALSPVVLCVPSSLNVKTLPELVELVRTDKKAHSYGNAGFGQTTHFYGEMLKRAANLDLTYVPYKGEAPFLNDLLAGHVSLGFLTVASSKPHIEAGRLVPLGVPGTSRSPLLPQVPTMQELGYKGFESVGWFGLLGPAGLPTALADDLNAVGNELIADRDVLKKLDELGLPPIGGSRQEFERAVKDDAILWAQIIKSTGIKMP